LKKSTQAVRAGTRHDKNMGGLNTPLLASSAIEYLDDSEVRYPRYFNTLNHDVVAEKMSALELAEAGLVTSSGMAAISGIFFGLLTRGDHIVFTEGLYGGTHALIVKELERFGITYSFTATDVKSIANACGPDTRMIYVESPSNPLLTIVDLAAVAAFAKPRGILTVIDNTFASPILQNPLVPGFDLVMHSGTKYLGGHSDLCCGVLVTRSDELGERFYFLQNSTGAILPPQDSWLLIRSLKTLNLRMERHCRNALQIATWLEDHPRVSEVYYPGLTSHPGHELTKRQCRDFGGMLSFRVESPGHARAVLRRLQLISFAESLGGVESLMTLPAVQTHADIPLKERERLGICESLLRLSVGIETVDDIIADLEQALG